MAEILAIVGGTAAGSQLLNYGVQSVKLASALPHYIRHSADMVQAWACEVSAMLHYLDHIEQRIGRLDTNTTRLLALCRRDAVALQSLLLPYEAASQIQKRLRLRELWFVLRKDHEIERAVTAFQRKYSLLTQSLPWVSPTALSPRAHNSTPVQRELFRHRARLSDTIRDVLVTMCFFGDAEIPVQLLCGLADSAILSEALDALVACMSIRSILSVSHIKMDSSLRKRMRLEVSALPDGPEYLDFVLNALSSELPAAFTQKDALQVGHNTNAHILSTLRAAMGISVERDVCQKAAYLAVRVTGYLHAAGQYAIAVGFMAPFRRWCQQQFPTEFQMLTGMREKECTALRLQGDSHNALRFARDIYHTRRQAYGKDDERTLCSLNSKGLIYYDLGNNSSASRCLHTAYESNAGLFGETHANTLVSANNLGLVYQSQGYHEDASDMFRRSLTGWLQTYGEDDTNVLTARSNLGTVLQCQRRWNEAKTHHHYVYKQRCLILGPKHHETVKSKANIALAINELGDHQRAEKMCREVIRVLEESLGPAHPDVLKSHTNLASTLFDQGKYADAESIVDKALPLMKEKTGLRHPSTLLAMEFRAITLHHMQNFTAALAAARDLVAVRSEAVGYRHPDTQRNVRHMMNLRLAVA